MDGVFADLGIKRLEALTAMGWPAARNENIDGWQAFLSAGHVHRTNSVWPLDFTGADIEAAIDRAIDIYRGHGFVPRFKLVEGAVSPPDLLDHLLARGFAPVSHVDVLARAIGPNVEVALPEGALIQLSDRPDETFIQTLAGQSAISGDGIERGEIARRAPGGSIYGAVLVEGQMACVGVAAKAENSFGFNGMRTHIDFRRKGLAAGLLRAMMAKAAKTDAAFFWLQVERDNGPAQALYRRFGFQRLYEYRTYSLSGSLSGALADTLSVAPS